MILLFFLFLDIEHGPTILFHIEFHICLHGFVFLLFRDGYGL
jgi:hypothetical protein